MRLTTICVVCFYLALMFLTQAAYAAKLVAFVVGIDNYDNLTSTQQLKKAVNDARTVARRSRN